MEAITTQWKRIEAHLQTLPQIEQPFFNPGATEEEIVALETAIGGIRFPDDFRFSLKRHNGQASSLPLVGMGPLLSTQHIVSNWSGWKKPLDDGMFLDLDDECYPDAGIKDTWWHPRWIPITQDGGGDFDCLDMEPEEEGTVGQVIQLWHEEGTRPLNAPSFLAWLTDCANHLEDGSLAWNDDEECFLAKEEGLLCSSGDLEAMAGRMAGRPSPPPAKIPGGRAG